MTIRLVLVGVLVGVMPMALSCRSGQAPKAPAGQAADPRTAAAPKAETPSPAQVPGGPGAAPTPAPAPAPPKPGAQAAAPAAAAPAAAAPVVAAAQVVADTGAPTGVDKDKLSRCYREVYCAQKKGEMDKILEIYKRYGFNTPQEFTKVWIEAARDTDWVTKIAHEVSKKCQ